MYQSKPYTKVDICGLDTSKLGNMTEEEKRALLLRCRAGDIEAREQMIMGNIRLVLSIVARFSGRRDTPDDLFQVGCIGLMKAIDNFNTDMDVRFSTYAVPMIIGELRRYLRDNNSIRVSRSMRDLAYRALALRESMSADASSEMTVEQIAERLGADVRDVSRAMEAIVEPSSLYDSVYGDGDDSVYVIDQLRDPEYSDESWVENLSLREALDSLSQRERDIITLRFYGDRTQMEIAEEIGISQAQVSRLEKNALAKMRRHF